MNDAQALTLEELVRLALPPETRVWCESDWRARQVTWVLSITAAESARVQAGDFVFLLPPYPDDLASHLARWAHIGVAGVALLGEPDAALIVAACQVQLPLVAIPANTPLRALERRALEFVLARDAALEQRATQVYQQLTTLATENAGLPAMAALIGRTTGKTVLIQDKRLNILASFAATENATRARLEEWVMNPANIPEAFRDRKRAAQHPITLEQALPYENRARIITPIIAQGMARGYLSLIAERGTFQAFDHLVATRGAAACALEMAKAKAVSEAEKRVRGGFVEALLAGNLSAEEAVSWAKRDRYNPEGTHTVIVVDWARKEHPSYRRLETVIHGIKRPTMLVHAREDEVIVFVRLENETGIERARLIAETIRHQTHAEFPNDPLAIGIGRATDSLIRLRDSYREARQALSLARRLASPTPLYFGELSVYRLLFLLEHHPELDAFRQEMIGALIEYDRTQHTNLLETLAAYFAHKGNLTQTAEALFIHRNTLLYRMERIREISGLDLDNPETRLGVELALRAHRLLLAREES